MTTETQVSYHSYLKVDDLLLLQEELSSPKHPDELLFIIIHQSHELWFKLIIHELERLIAYTREENFYESSKTIDRVIVIFKALIQQIDVLHTLTPDEFLGYRDLLAPASGFQSFQYRIIEFMCGLKDSKFIAIHQSRPHVQAELQRVFDLPSLWEILTELLHVPKMNLPDGDLIHKIKHVYLNRKPFNHLFHFFERLVELDLTLQLWRMRHFKNAERVIGHKRGTGGSEGVDYLQSILSRKLFPELWAVRTVL